MTPQRIHSPAEAAQISERIGQAFDFLLDVLADPAIVDDIPDGSTLRFSEVMIGEVTFHLTAFLGENPPWPWTARVTAPPELAAKGRQPFEAPAGMGGKWGSPPLHPEHGRTAEEALSALEEKLRDSRHRFEGSPPGRRTA